VRILRQLRTNAGQGLLEVVVVTVLFGTAVATVVPVYLGFQGRQADKTARANLVAAVPMAEAYRQDHGSYRAMDAIDLLRIDPRVSPTLTVAWVKRHGYCLTDTIHGKTFSLHGPYHNDPPISANGSCT